MTVIKPKKEPVTAEQTLEKLERFLTQQETTGKADWTFSKPEVSILKKVAKIAIGTAAFFSLLDTIKYWFVIVVVIYTQWHQIVAIMGLK